MNIQVDAAAINRCTWQGETKKILGLYLTEDQRSQVQGEWLEK